LPLQVVQGLGLDKVPAPHAHAMADYQAPGNSVTHRRKAHNAA